MKDKKKLKEINIFEMIFVGIIFTIYIYSFHLIPVLSPFFIALSPVFGALLAAYFYRRSGGILAFIIIPLFFGISAQISLGLYLIFGLPPLITAIFMKKEQRLELTTVVNTFITIAGFITFMYWLRTVLNVDFQEIMNDVTSQYIRLLEESNMFDKQTIDTLNINLHQYMETLKQIWLAIIVIASIIIAVIQSYLARVFTTLIKWKEYNLRRVFYYSLPRSTVIFYIICYLIMEVTNVEIIDLICFSLIMVMIFLVTLNGISFCIYSAIKTKETRFKILLGVATPFIALFFPTIMTVVGGIDAALHRRKAA